jgi:hypothetical protein
MAIRGNPLIDSTPLGEAEPYGDHLTHPRGHAAVWERYQRIGIAPIDMEYEESPRGLVTFETKTRRFTLLADRCILNDKGIVHQIMSNMSLPRNTETDTDIHYRCSVCLRGGNERPASVNDEP